jgi:hypothetical protein
MRTNDAPGERGALADAGAAGRRPDGGAGDLRQRLAEMRASHPSSPRYGDRDGGPDAGDGWRDGNGESDGAGEPGAAAGDGDRDGANRGAAEGDSGGLPGPEGARPRGRPGAPGHASPGHASPEHAETGAPGPLGGSEPYRPWFSSGESLEPWFTEDPPG